MLEILTQKIRELAIIVVAAEWMAQGHNLSGNALKSMETKVSFSINTLIIEGYIADYMAINNEGVKSNRIPYTPNSGNKSSKYISGLIDYAKRRMGASDKEAKNIAFAIASKHKQEGMPTKASARFSSTGKRTGFIEQAFERNADKFIETIENVVKYSVELTVEGYYKSQLNR